jgi:hypothetical protein
MYTKPILAAAVSALATAASAGSFDTPYALSATHEDFLGQLEQTAGEPGEIGAAARAALGLVEPHIQVEENLVLPFLGFAEAVSQGGVYGPLEAPERLESLAAELALMPDGQTDVISALVELFAAAQYADQPEVAQLARRMIWHETADAEILYPAAAVVAAHVRTPMVGADTTYSPTDASSLYGPDPTPMMGVGSPHPVVPLP